MCRSANEAGGQQRCSADARARFADAGAEVAAVLELLEERMAAEHLAVIGPREITHVPCDPPVVCVLAGACCGIRNCLAQRTYSSTNAE